MTKGKKKRGRVPEGKMRRTFSLDEKVVAFIDRLPEGERSSYINTILLIHIEKLRVNERNDDP